MMNTSPNGISIPARITLTERQSQRLFGLLHLEGGKNPLEIVDELLNADQNRRNSYNLSFADESLVARFVASAMSHGPWPNVDELVSFIKQVLNYRIDQLPREVAFSLVQLAQEAIIRNWDLAEFVDQATRSHNIVNIFLQYTRGEISSQRAMQSLRALMDQ